MEMELLFHLHSIIFQIVQMEQPHGSIEVFRHRISECKFLFSEDKYLLIFHMY